MRPPAESYTALPLRHRGKSARAGLGEALPGAKRGGVGLLSTSYLGARDLYQIVAPEMSDMMDAMLSAPGVMGARQAGAGFGGCMVTLVRVTTPSPRSAPMSRRITGVAPGSSRGLRGERRRRRGPGCMRGRVPESLSPHQRQDDALPHLVHADVIAPEHRAQVAVEVRPHPHVNTVIHSGRGRQQVKIAGCGVDKTRIRGRQIVPAIGRCPADNLDVLAVARVEVVVVCGGPPMSFTPTP